MRGKIIKLKTAQEYDTYDIGFGSSIELPFFLEGLASDLFSKAEEILEKAGESDNEENEPKVLL